LLPLHEIEEEKKNSKVSKKLKFSTISLAAPTPKANVSFDRVLLQGWRESGLFWFTSAAGLTQGLWHCPPREEAGRRTHWRTPLATPRCAAKSPRGGNWGWGLCTPTGTKETHHKAFYNSSLSLAEGNRHPFFLQ